MGAGAAEPAAPPPEQQQQVVVPDEEIITDRDAPEVQQQKLGRRARLRAEVEAARQFAAAKNAEAAHWQQAAMQAAEIAQQQQAALQQQPSPQQVELDGFKRMQFEQQMLQLPIEQQLGVAYQGLTLLQQQIERERAEKAQMAQVPVQQQQLMRRDLAILQQTTAENWDTLETLAQGLGFDARHPQIVGALAQLGIHHPRGFAQAKAWFRQIGGQLRAQQQAAGRQQNPANAPVGMRAQGGRRSANESDVWRLSDKAFNEAWDRKMSEARARRGG